MRTTLRLDDELLRRAKVHAARHRRTLTSVVEEGLRTVLANADRGGRGEPVILPISTNDGGLRPGIDLDDSAALLDALDDHDAAP